MPAEELSKGVAAEILPAFGFSPGEADNPNLNLGTVVVEGYSYGGGGSWSIMARSVTMMPDIQVFGSVDLLDDTSARISPEQALASAREWIVNSEGTEWVPGPLC